MERAEIIKPPGNLAELQEAAKNEPMERKGAKAIIENYAKRNDMTIEEAAKILGYKNTRGVNGAVAAGSILKNDDGTIDDESVERYVARKREKEAKKMKRRPKKDGRGEDERQIHSAEKITTDDDTKFFVEKEPISKPLKDITREDDDDTIIVMTKGELKEAFRRWLHSQKRVSVEEILDIVA